jgi:hypothetical protein
VADFVLILAAVGAYWGMSESRPLFMPRKQGPGFGWVIDAIWPTGETEQIRGFFTDHQAVQWIAEKSEAWLGNIR